MRVATNKTVVYRNTRNMQRTATLGMLTLLVSLAFSFNRQYVIWAYPLLLVGTIALVLSAHSANRWADALRGDVVLGRVLKSLDQEYRLYNFMLPADHVLLAPSGVFALQLQRQHGPIICEKERCRQRLKLVERFRFFQEETMGDPMRKARNEAARVQRFLEKSLPGVQVPVQPMVVFIHPDAQLTATNPAVPVATAANVKAELRNAGQNRQLPRETYSALVQLLDGKST